jgi:hypothetical protein
MRPTDVDAKNQANNHGTNMKHLENTEYFYSRSLLAAVNLSAGILITAIMIFRLKNSSV